MRIGIDCDGVLRDLIPDITDKIKETHPEHAEKLLTPNSWNWEDWIPFWTDDETEKYVFETHFEEFFGTNGSVIESSLEDWPKLKEWAKENGHELVLVSAQREQSKELTTQWLQRWGFMFDEIHYTHDKWSIDVDVLIDDSPEKLEQFGKRSISYGKPICYKQTWNTECQNSMVTIDRLSDIIGKLFG